MTESPLWRFFYSRIQWFVNGFCPISGRSTDTVLLLLLTGLFKQISTRLFLVLVESNEVIVVLVGTISFRELFIIENGLLEWYCWVLVLVVKSGFS